MALSKITTSSLTDGAVSNIKVGAGIDSVKIGAGDVSNTEHAYLNSISSNVQTQIAGVGAGVTLGTTVASTSGTAIDFTGIPAGTKRISLNLTGVSLNGSTDYAVYLGDSAGFETSGYLGTGNYNGPTDQGIRQYTGSMGMFTSDMGSFFHGRMILELVDSNTFTWNSMHVLGQTGAYIYVRTGGAQKSLSAELTQIRIAAENGSSTWDAGKINIQYE